MSKASERRKAGERRKNEAIAQFPIITALGICVRKDRRKTPDRRLSNIVVHETSIKEEIFDMLFCEYVDDYTNKR